MNKILLYMVMVLLVSHCKPIQEKAVKKNKNATTQFSIAFGSCNKTNVNNLLWDDILIAEPNLWIWGGDIVYADTDKVENIAAEYKKQNAVSGYIALKAKTPVIGTWDDHDYGLNDGGVESSIKKGSQQAFLDFMDVPKNSPRRTREGVYTAHTYIQPKGSIKVIVLDTRYFRTAITPDTKTTKRITPNAYGDGTILGETQWAWLSDELYETKADYTIIISSIQFLSNEHGFETWGNFPHEVDKLKQLLVTSKVKRPIILSGDRHISEFSMDKILGMSNPLIDFTSSGLTHAYTQFNGEDNPFRVGKVVAVESFGLLEFNFDTDKVNFKMLGNNGELLGSLEQSYE